MINHLKKVHNIPKSPINKGFIDITTDIDPDNNKLIKGKYSSLNFDRKYSIKRHS